VRTLRAGLAQASVFQVEELRAAPLKLKLRQPWSLLASAHLREGAAQREAGVQIVMDRWKRQRQASNVSIRP
jgi:hypothetical protein